MCSLNRRLCTHTHIYIYIYTCPHSTPQPTMSHDHEASHDIFRQAININYIIISKKERFLMTIIHFQRNFFYLLISRSCYMSAKSITSCGSSVAGVFLSKPQKPQGPSYSTYRTIGVVSMLAKRKNTIHIDSYRLMVYILW